MNILTFRLSMFGDYNKYSATTANIINWTKMFQELGYEFLPNIIDSKVPQIPFISVLPQSGEKRVQFVSKQGDLVVRVIPERVDAEMTLGETDDLLSLLSEKTITLEQLLTAMLNELNDVPGTRLAYYVDALIPEPSPDAFNSIYEKNNIDLNVNGGIECVEWGHRLNTRVQFTVNESQEMCNALFNLESALLSIQVNKAGEEAPTVTQQKGLHFSADINTVAENTVERFEISDLPAFIEQAHSVFHDFYTRLENKFVG